MKPVQCVLLVFVMSVSDASVRWYSIGDWGDPWFDIQHKVAEAMNEYSYDFDAQFIIALGDNFYQNGIHSVDDPRIDLVWRDTYNKTNLHQNGTGWWLCLGNHDYGFGRGEEWYQVALSDVEPLWNMPYIWHENTWTDGEVSVQIILIDTEALDEDLNNQTLMMEWFNETLTNSTADWVLVGGHHPIFSCGEKGPVSGSYYDKLLPALDYHRGKVDVYMSGHDHNVQLLQKKNDPGYLDFVVSGAAGALMYRENPTCGAILDAQYGINKTFMEVTGAFAAMEATSEYLNITFIDYNLTTLYTYTRYKVPGMPDSIFELPSSVY